MSSAGDVHLPINVRELIVIFDQDVTVGKHSS